MPDGDAKAASRVTRWRESQRGGAADRHQGRSGAMPVELYRHDRNIEANAIKRYCKFHQLSVDDIPVEVLLTEIQLSSLGTAGWAFANVEDWEAFDAHMTTGGKYYCFNEPNQDAMRNTSNVSAQSDLRARVERSVREQVVQRMDGELVEVLKILGTLDEVVNKTVAIIESRDTNADGVFPIDEWVDRTIEVTLDSGACDHILDLDDAPGYANFLAESPGSKRGQEYVVGNGAEVPNEGQATLNLEAEGGSGKHNFIKSIFQVAEITRPLMSVSKICELGHKCVFDENKADVIAKDGTVLCSFQRKGGLYVAQMRLKSPEGFQRPAR